MSKTNDKAYIFVVEWFDPMPQIKRKYLLKYFVDQHACEMIDLKSKKMFLKKSPCPPEISREHFIMGGKVLLYSRMLEIVGYGDLKTQDELEFVDQRSMIIIPQDDYSNWGKIISALNKSLFLVEIKTLLIPQIAADATCQIVDLDPRESSMYTSGVSLMAVFNGPDGFEKTQSVAKNHGIICTKSDAQTRELYALLCEGPNSRNIADTATLDNCTCGLVKPHAVKSRYTGDILDHVISQGYEVSAIASLYFNSVQAAEFYEVYKDVVPEYVDHVAQLSSGLCVAMELRAEAAVTCFRATAGPWDADMAKELQPDTIRGRFAQDMIRNAVHCTDLATDGALEVEYCFKIMA